MYIESKAEGLNGPARIGRVTFNRTGRTLYYKGQSFQSLKGSGFKANYRETETGEEYWISGPRRDGLDRLYGKSALVVKIDVDVREEYWTEVRKKPELKHRKHTRASLPRVRMAGEKSHYSPALLPGIIRCPRTSR